MIHYDEVIKWFEQRLTQEPLRYGERQCVHVALSALREKAEYKTFGDEAEGRLDAIIEQNGIGLSDRIFLQDLLSAWESEAERENPQPLEEWDEIDDGDCLWWKFPIEEPPYCGSPLDADWSGDHTHFTHFVCPKDPKEAQDDQV